MNMPCALAFPWVDVKKVQRRVFAAFLQKAAGIVTMSGERSGELSPAPQIRFKVGHRAEVHSYAALSVDIHDSVHMTPQVEADQSVGEEIESLLFVSRQRVVRGFVTLVAPEPAQLSPVSRASFRGKLGPDSRLIIMRDRHPLRRR